jgi:hypothetical protein
MPVARASVSSTVVVDPTGADLGPIASVAIFRTAQRGALNVDFLPRPCLFPFDSANAGTAVALPANTEVALAQESKARSVLP